MLHQLPTPETDPLWSLISAYRHDRRQEKIDLIIGVYRDETGQTPIMNVVQQAEHRLAAEAHSKSYRALSGNGDFNHGMARFLLGPGNSRFDTQCTIQTVGGTGALRLLADLIALAAPRSTIWSSTPGYVNHQPIMESAGHLVRLYRWQEKDGAFDISVMLADLADARRGDIVILHGCCHNPTGIDMPLDAWRTIAEHCAQAGLIPLIDMAYQGFGDGPDEDAAGLRLMTERLDTVLIAASCSKNMGLYCERTGAAVVLAPDRSSLHTVRCNLERIARANYSMPPEHGAAIASILFADPAPWLAELETARQRVANIRVKLADALEALGAPETLQGLRRQKGMFSTLPFDADQMQMLRNAFGVYGTLSGRINIAGVALSQVERLALALTKVCAPAAL